MRHHGKHGFVFNRQAVSRVGGFAIDFDLSPHDSNPALVTGLQIVGDGIAATKQRIVDVQYPDE